MMYALEVEVVEADHHHQVVFHPEDLSLRYLQLSALMLHQVSTPKKVSLDPNAK